MTHVNSPTREPEVTRIPRTHGRCDHCGTTAPRARMIADPDADSETGLICAEGFGCASPRQPLTLRVAGAVVQTARLARSETPAKLAAAAEVEMLFEGLPAAPMALSEGTRREVLKLLQARVAREASLLASLACGTGGEGVCLNPKRLTAQGRAVEHAARTLARWRKATMRRGRR